MVDIRQDVCGVIVGGTPAPGINGVISAVVIKCLTLGIVPFGFFDGFKYLKKGITKYCTELQLEDVTRIYNQGGSILRSSKEQLDTKIHVENTIRALQHVRIKYLITIGGTQTAYSAHKLAQGYRDKSLLLNTETIIHQSNIELMLQPNESNTNELDGVLITHVPKTIFNDLPLPSNCFTFGYSTAREIGCKIVTNLAMDAKSFNRYYIITAIGSKTGHLALGIATASASTLCLIPEQFQQRTGKKSNQYLKDAKKKFDVQLSAKALLNNTEFNKKHGFTNDLIEEVLIDEEEEEEKKNNNDDGIELNEYLDICDATMIKRASEGKFYGVIIVSEGLVDLLKKSELNQHFNGSLVQGHELFALTLKNKLFERWNNRNYDMFLKSKFVGFECRSASPNAHDMILSRELGYSAVLTCQIKKVNATIVTMKGGELTNIPLSEIVDPNTGELITKSVDITSLSYKVSQTYMIKLTRNDLLNQENVKKYAKIAGMNVKEFREKYSYVAWTNNLNEH